MNLKHVAFSFLLIAFVLCCGLTVKAENTLLSLGDHLFSVGNYDAAITEYKRFLFFHPDDVRAAETYHNIGRAYRAQEQWSAAIAAMRAAMHHATDSETKSTYQLELAVMLIAGQNYELAQLELIKVTLRSPSPGLLRRAAFLKGVAYLYQFRWEEAQEVLQHYTDDAELNTLFDSAIRTPRKSVKVAKILSAILPGAGQIYAGDWGGWFKRAFAKRCPRFRSHQYSTRWILCGCGFVGCHDFPPILSGKPLSRGESGGGF